MCVLLFDAINGCSFKQSHVKDLLFRKTDVLKTSNWKENLKKCTSFEEHKDTRYIRENV